MDLFGGALVPGLAMAFEVVTEPHEAELIQRIEEAGLAPFQFGAFVGRRLTLGFGRHYDFAAHRLVEAEPVPAWLDEPRRKAACLAGVGFDDIAHVLLTRYDPGTGIGWHKDRHAFAKVIGLSLGSATELSFRRRRPDGRFERVRAPLPRRSFYLLDGAARDEWEHGIPAHRDRRYSITFRTLRPGFLAA